MAGRRRLERKTDDRRPVVTDDFIYDEPVNDINENLTDSFSSDTPEEAVRKLRRRSQSLEADHEPDIPDLSGNTEENQPDKGRNKVYSSGIMLDENLQPVYESGKKPRKSHPVLRGIVLVAVTLSLLIAVGSFIFHRIYGDAPYLDMPENAIASVVTPVQSFFSGLTESVFGYFRTVKLRANIEQAYNDLLADYEQMVYKAMIADQLSETLRQQEELNDEVQANLDMKPLPSRIIGKSDSNYFGTFTIDKGSKDGVEDHMAVTYGYALVGYTENVMEDKSTVRTIIDSDASVAALIKSSRDQGTVRGTLGNGEPLCRMYYLKDDSLPRPGDEVITSGVGFNFPKDIPIGTVLESTRGMDANKQYIVIQPYTDFRHLEYVLVLRYKPTNPEPIESRESKTDIELYTLEPSKVPPVISEYASDFSSDFDEDEDDNEDEDGAEPEETIAPTPPPTDTPAPTPSPTPSPQPTPYETPLPYNIKNVRGEPTPTPTPTFAPTPTPYFTPDPDDMIFEEE